MLDAAERIGRGRRGIVLLRSVLETWHPGIEPGSVAEVRLQALEWDVQAVGKLDLCAGEPRLAELARRWGAA